MCLFAAVPLLQAADPAASPSPASSAASCPNCQKHHQHGDVNEFLDKHPKLKDKVLAKFDTNHNGKLDGDEVKAFEDWRKEHRGEFRNHHKKDDSSGTKAAPTASPTP